MDLAMPRLSDTMEEGTLGRWLKHEGESIEKGEVIAEIQTDKANMELEAFQGGVLQRILVQEGETVAIGETIAVIGDGSEPSGEAPAEQPRAQENAKPPAQENVQPDGQQERRPERIIGAGAEVGGDTTEQIERLARRVGPRSAELLLLAAGARPEHLEEDFFF